MITAGKFWLSRWTNPGPLCCLLLLLLEFGRQAPVRGLNGRLGGSAACGADLNLGISCCGNASPEHAQEAGPASLPRHSPDIEAAASPKQRWEEWPLGCASIEGGSRDKASGNQTRIPTPLVFSFLWIQLSSSGQWEGTIRCSLMFALLSFKKLGDISNYFHFLLSKAASFLECPTFSVLLCLVLGNIPPSENGIREAQAFWSYIS